jgi:hypothetical protein
METVENKKTRTPRPKGSVVDYRVELSKQDLDEWARVYAEQPDKYTVKTAEKSVSLDGNSIMVHVGIARRRLKAVTTYVEE